MLGQKECSCSYIGSGAIAVGPSLGNLSKYNRSHALRDKGK
jgi:hypothetical protein